ncbi:hypothetical protein Btru_003273 [Bulinus truncatus]|nr:hypothetical protein Btru_003273 [Bulinus truncatus]
MSFGPVVILKRPTKKVMTLEERLQRLFSPLSDSLWLMPGLVWLVTTVVLSRHMSRESLRLRRLAKAKKQATLREGESFTCLNRLVTVAPFCRQGNTPGHHDPLGARVVVFFLVVLCSHLSNNVHRQHDQLPTSGSSSKRTHRDSIDDLANQDDIDFGVIKGGSTEVFLLLKMSFVSNLESGIAKVRKPKPFALIAESAMAKYYTKQKPCDLYMVGDFTTHGTYSLAFPLNFNATFVRNINMAIVKLRESGKIKAMEDRWFTGECKGYLLEQSTDNKFHIPPFYEVDLGSFSGALIILGLGLILGSIVTALEICLFKFAEASEKEDEEDREKLNEEKSIPLAANMEPITDV